MVSGQDVAPLYMIFSVRQLQEKCIEQHRTLYQVFVDLTKAFETVSREALFTVLGKLESPPNLVHMITELHRDMDYSIFNGTLSDKILIENDVKQGISLHPLSFPSTFLCFSLMHSVIVLQSPLCLVLCLLPF